MTIGRFIALEGGEGAGKSTQARLLAEALRERGLEVVVTREPGGTPGAEAIRSLLLNGVAGDEGESWNPRAEALLFAAARSDHVHRLIRPAMARGAWVVCDRYLDSSRAYQGGGSGLSDPDILELHRIGSQGLLPDLTLLIEVSPETAAERLARRDEGVTDRIGSRNDDYHARVSSAFRALAQSDAARFARIDGNGALEATHALILKSLSPLLDGVA